MPCPPLPRTAPAAARRESGTTPMNPQRRSHECSAATASAYCIGSDMPVMRLNRLTA